MHSSLSCDLFVAVDVLIQSATSRDFSAKRREIEFLGNLCREGLTRSSNEDLITTQLN